jgi:hypothetical protein
MPKPSWELKKTQGNRALKIQSFISSCALFLMASCASIPSTDTGYDPQVGNATIASKYAI